MRTDRFYDLKLLPVKCHSSERKTKVAHQQWFIFVKWNQGSLKRLKCKNDLQILNLMYDLFVFFLCGLQILFSLFFFISVHLLIIFVFYICYCDSILTVIWNKSVKFANTHTFYNAHERLPFKLGLKSWIIKMSYDTYMSTVKLPIHDLCHFSCKRKTSNFFFVKSQTNLNCDLGHLIEIKQAQN